MKAEILNDLEAKLWASLANGEIKVLIHQTLPVTAAEAAHAILERQENLGKVVLMMK